MKFTLSWLKDHLETEASVEEIVETLTDLGLEVEEVEDRGARLADFTIGKVVSAEQHPDADRLRVCQVETDEGVKQIICGAPNAREGITVVVAKPGVYVPGIDTTIGVGKIRGIESFGMMASEREMELSDEHSGIIELPSGEVGQRFVDWLAENDPAKVDPVIEIAITPNRQDALGVHGIARDLAARGLGTLKPHAPDPVPGSLPLPGEGGDRRRHARRRAAFRGSPDPWRQERAERRRGCRTGCAPSGCGPFRRWSISPTSSPTT
jgi:phenylalanyl-tRNA synthetase beta chain